MTKDSGITEETTILQETLETSTNNMIDKTGEMPTLRTVNGVDKVSLNAVIHCKQSHHSMVTFSRQWTKWTVWTKRTVWTERTERQAMESW